MPPVHIVKSHTVQRSFRVAQVEGMFDVAPHETQERRWDFPVVFPPNWGVGLIVGPSGSGKSTVAKKLFGGLVWQGGSWSDKALVDDFPAAMDTVAITTLLSSVGFNSPPSWRLPFSHLSTGEQFRVEIARALAESKCPVMDEFTSVVDRTVAQIGSAAVAKFVRKEKRQFVAVSCHTDIVDWLDPDWVLELPLGVLTERKLQGRPKVELEVVRADWQAWHLFKAHHYMTAEINKSAWCFVALLNGIPAAFCAVVVRPHKQTYFGAHRTVCLPQYQGIGIGAALSEYVASLFAWKKPFRSNTSNQALGHARANGRWKIKKTLPAPPGNTRPSLAHKLGHNLSRLTRSFVYVGQTNMADALAFGIHL